MKTQIESAADRPLFTSESGRPLTGAPQMTDTIRGWAEDVIFCRTRQTVASGLVKQATTRTAGHACIAPLNTQALAKKSEGERAWQWFTAFIVGVNEELQPGDFIEIQNEKYRIMGQGSYGRHGFLVYEAVKNYATRG